MQRLSARMRRVVVAVPGHLDHQGSLYRWKFRGSDGMFAMPVPGRVTIDETRAMLSLGLAGLGLMHGSEPISPPFYASMDAALWAFRNPGPGRRSRVDAALR